MTNSYKGPKLASPAKHTTKPVVLNRLQESGTRGKKCYGPIDLNGFREFCAPFATHVGVQFERLRDKMWKNCLIPTRNWLVAAIITLLIKLSVPETIIRLDLRRWSGNNGIDNKLRVVRLLLLLLLLSLASSSEVLDLGDERYFGPMIKILLK